MNEINYKSNKADVITESICAIDYHIAENKRLKQQQVVLAGISAFLLLITIL